MASIKMNVLHVNLAKGFRGGERQTVLLIKALSKLGVNQALACRKDSPMREQLACVDGLTFINANNQLQGYLSNFKADIVHAHEAKSVHWAFINKLMKGVPYLITRRVNSMVKNKIFNRLTYSSASFLVAVSEVIKKSLDQQMRGHTLLIPDASSDFIVNDKVASIQKKEWKDFYVVGHAGALVDSDKGQKVLIDAARLLKDKMPTLKVVFLGDGRDGDELKYYGKDLDCLSWMGFKQNVADYISVFDVFAFPSRNEGLGSVLLDVMNLNVPIVAANVGGIPDIIKDRKTGLLIEPNSASALADAIEEIYLDAELRKKLIHGASVFVKDFSPEIMAEKYYSTYQDILKKNP